MFLTRGAETGAIIHVGPANLELPASHGGAIERRMIELAAAQVRRGERVIVCSKGDRDREVDHQGVTIRYIKCGASLLARRMEYPLRFVHQPWVAGARIVHIHSRAEIAWLLRKQNTPVPTVLSCDYHFEPMHERPVLKTLSRAIWRRFIHSASIVAPVSGYCAEVHRRYWQLDDNQTEIIPNGVDTRRFRPDLRARNEWRSRLGVEGRIVILYVGRICRQKGIDLLIEAYSRIKKRTPAAILVAVGPADRFGINGTNKLIQELRAVGAMHLPPVHDNDLNGIYNSSDVFVMPTRELEMFGMAALEAQACGRPVVASDHGGLREIVPNSAGLRFLSGNAGSLQQALTPLIDYEALRASFGEGGFQNARRFEWDRVAERCEEVYSQVESYSSSPQGAMNVC